MRFSLSKFLDWLSESAPVREQEKVEVVESRVVEETAMVESNKIPRGHAEITCRDCKAKYLIRRKDLTKVANSHDGYCPCEKCGSHNTTWAFSEDFS